MLVRIKKENNPIDVVKNTFFYNNEHHLKINLATHI